MELFNILTFFNVFDILLKSYVIEWSKTIFCYWSLKQSNKYLVLNWTYQKKNKEGKAKLCETFSKVLIKIKSLLAGNSPQKICIWDVKKNKTTQNNACADTKHKINLTWALEVRFWDCSLKKWQDSFFINHSKLFHF